MMTMQGTLKTKFVTIDWFHTPDNPRKWHEMRKLPKIEQCGQDICSRIIHATHDRFSYLLTRHQFLVRCAFNKVTFNTIYKSWRRRWEQFVAIHAFPMSCNPTDQRRDSTNNCTYPCITNTDNLSHGIYIYNHHYIIDQYWRIVSQHPFDPML